MILPKSTAELKLSLSRHAEAATTQMAETSNRKQQEMGVCVAAVCVYVCHRCRLFAGLRACQDKRDAASWTMFWPLDLPTAVVVWVWPPHQKCRR